MRRFTPPTPAAATALVLCACLCPAAARAAQRPSGRGEALLRPSPQVLLDPKPYYAPDLFTLKSPPKPGDWMAEHPEPPQSFGEYVAARPWRPTQGRHTIYLAPLGPMAALDNRRLAILKDMLAAYYMMPVAMGKPITLDGVTKRDREQYGVKTVQYLTEDILYARLRPALPDDAYCLLAVTMADLYPEPSWNYVFGMASLKDRVGVYSLVRFFPAFWGRAESRAEEQRGIQASLRTLVHETGHMFTVHHCQKYQCVMNGSNHLGESSAQPIHLCPDCLMKLRWNIGFDIIPRYEGLRSFYAAHGMDADAAWVEKRLRQCRGEAVDAAATPPAVPAPASPGATGERPPAPKPPTP